MTASRSFGTIRVPVDHEGLKLAVNELLEEARTAPERERTRRLAETAANAADLLKSVEFERTLSEGYYAWVLHLIKVERALELGLLSRLPADEVAGLAALDAGRAAHERAHPPCPQCGGGLDSPQAFSCRCGWSQSFGRKAS